MTLDTTGERAGLPNSMTVLPFPWVPWCCLKGNKVFVFSHLIKFSDVMFMHILKIWYIYVLNLLHVTLLYLLFTGIWAPEQQNIPTAYMSVWFFDYIICFSAKCFDIFFFVEYFTDWNISAKNTHCFIYISFKMNVLLMPRSYKLGFSLQIILLISSYLLSLVFFSQTSM